MTGFLSLPIRLIGILLMAAFCVNAMSPLRSLEFKLSNAVSNPAGNPITTGPPPATGSSSVLSLGLALVAIVSIWLIYRTWQQHIALAESELRNRRITRTGTRSHSK